MNLCNFIIEAKEWILGWPFIIYVVSIGLICTFACRFIQFTHFFESWKTTFAPQKPSKSDKNTLSPFQAFLSALNSSVGNGTLAGIATAIALGGPGATFWIFTITFILMILRFAEVYLSSYYSTQTNSGAIIGGPMRYLKDVNRFLPYIYSVVCLFFGFTVGNMMQSNSINISLEKTTGIESSLICSVLAALFVGFIILGGASRVAKASEAMVPFKVGLFYSCAFIILAYHYSAILPSILLIIKAAFTPQAISGGVLGLSVQHAIREGISRSVSSTESGVGTTGILFGSTSSKYPFKEGLMGMLSSFISSIGGLLTALIIVVSGVWNSGNTSIALTTDAFDTVFGAYGCWITMVLTVSFGAGVLVTYSYVTRKAWLFLTRGRYLALFGVIYCAMAFAGPLVDVKKLWAVIEVTSALMIFINLFGILWLVKTLQKGVADAIRKTS